MVVERQLGKITFSCLSHEFTLVRRVRTHHTVLQCHVPDRLRCQKGNEFMQISFSFFIVSITTLTKVPNLILPFIDHLKELTHPECDVGVLVEFGQVDGELPEELEEHPGRHLRRDGDEEVGDGLPLHVGQHLALAHPANHFEI